MTFFTILESLLIGPLKLVFEIIFDIANRVIGHPRLAIIVLSLILYKDRCLIVKIQHNGRLIVINCKEIFMLSKLVEYALYVHIYAINVDFY